jgi:hypothetical protein
LQNSCLHRGGPVCNGPLVDGVLTCPWHGYQYSLLTGELLVDRSVKLPRYPVEIRGDEVYLRVPVVVRDPVEIDLEDIFARAEAKAAAAAPRSLAPNQFLVAELPSGQIKLGPFQFWGELALRQAQGERESLSVRPELVEGQLSPNLKYTHQAGQRGRRGRSRV